jgi:ribonuclease T2
MEPLSQVNFRFVLFVVCKLMTRRASIRRSALFGAFALVHFFFFSEVTVAQVRQHGAVGQFDFYVLSLSWSPSYCEAAAGRSGGTARDRQCSGRPFAFVVHGLWPQYERGFPSSCQIPAPRLPRAIVDEMLDIMPSPRLVFHEWDRHGTCSGLSPRAYFDLVRAAWGAVTIPKDYMQLDQPVSVTPRDVVNAFLGANPRLGRDAINVSCDGRRLTEIRICLTKTLSFRNCPGMARYSCRRDNIVMPAVRSR